MMASNPTSSYHSPQPHPRSLREQHAALQPHQPYGASLSSSVLPGPSKPPPQRTKNSAMAAQSDDIKYMAKYKDLKQKVKDIELDNDRLHLRVVKTKKNIQRLRIERAILYERLSSMPVAELPGQPQQHPAHAGVHPHHVPHNMHPQYAPLISPDLESAIQAQHMARRHAEAQMPQDAERMHGQPLFSPAQIQATVERRQLEASHRGNPYEAAPPGAHPAQARADLRYPIGRPPSPPRSLEHFPPMAHSQQTHGSMEVDRPPPSSSSRSRRAHGPSIHAHPAMSHEGDRSPLPPSLPPPNTLSYVPPPHSHSRQNSNVTTSPRLEQHERERGPTAHPSEAQYSGASGPRRTPSQRDRERDRERTHTGGSGLPPMRTRQPDPHPPSPRPNSSSSHSGYAHPPQPPFSSPDDRSWEREREFPPHHMRIDERQDARMRERRDLHEPSHSNGSAGYRDGHSRRYEGEHGNGPVPDNYPRSRRSSQGHLPTESPRSQDRDRDRDRREYAQDYQYEYARRQDGETVHSRRRSYGEMETDRPEGAYERHRPTQRQRRDSQDEHDRRQVHREADVAQEDVVTVPRVQEGEPME